MNVTLKKHQIQDFPEKLKKLKDTQNLSLKKHRADALLHVFSKYSAYLEKRRSSLAFSESKTVLRKISQSLPLKKRFLKRKKKLAAFKRKALLALRTKVGAKARSNSKTPQGPLGILYLKRRKRNIYLTLCDSQNRLKASLSSGYLKFKGTKLKSKARKAMYNLKKLAHMLVGLILKGKFRWLHLKFKSSFPKRVKKTFLRILGYKRSRFKICKLSRYRCRPHNGCRRPKMRRK